MVRSYFTAFGYDGPNGQYQTRVYAGRDRQAADAAAYHAVDVGRFRAANVVSDKSGTVYVINRDEIDAGARRPVGADDVVIHAGQFGPAPAMLGGSLARAVAHAERAAAGFTGDSGADVVLRERWERIARELEAAVEALRRIPARKSKGGC